MSLFPESLDPVRSEVLAQAPILRYFLFLPPKAELVENPQFRTLIETRNRHFCEHLGANWREQYLPIIKHFDDSLKALHNGLSPQGREDCMMLLLFIGYELGKDHLGVFLSDVQRRMEDLGLLDMTLGIGNHDTHRGHDFVEAVMRIGADIRKNRPEEEPFDWRTIPPDIS